MEVGVFANRTPDEPLAGVLFAPEEIADAQVYADSLKTFPVAILQATRAALVLSLADVEARLMTTQDADMWDAGWGPFMDAALMLTAVDLAIAQQA